MTHMTFDEFTIIQARLDAKLGKTKDLNDIEDIANNTSESALQSKIKAYCKAKGWPILSFPRTPAVKRFLPAGYPDDTIILPFGTVLFLEGKTETGRVSPEQKLMRNMFRALGHVIHEIRSYKKFLEIVEGVMKRFM